MGNSKYLDPSIDIYMEIDEIFYIAGEQVKGCAYINAKKGRQYSMLRVVLIGKQYVYWADQQSIGDKRNNKQKSDHHNSSKIISENKIVHQNQYINYECHFELFDFMGKIEKGQYSFPFSFVLPMMMAGSFYQGANNYILYGLTTQLVKQSDPEKNQKYSLNLNVVEPVRVLAKPLTLTKTISASNNCYKPFNGSTKLQITQSMPFAVNGSLLNFSYKCEKPVELTLKIHLSRKRIMISKQRTTKYKTDWKQLLGIKKLSSQETFQIEIPAELNLSTAIGSITAQFYVIQIEIFQGCCNRNNFGVMEFHLIVNTKEPKVRKPEKIPPPKKWDPTVYPVVQFLDMRPFKQRISTKMPYFNLNDEYYSANMAVVSGYHTSKRISYSPNPKLQNIKSNSNYDKKRSTRKIQEKQQLDSDGGGSDRRMLTSDHENVIKPQKNMKKQQIPVLPKFSETPKLYEAPDIPRMAKLQSEQQILKQLMLPQQIDPANSHGNDEYLSQSDNLHLTIMSKHKSNSNETLMPSRRKKIDNSAMIL